MDCSQHHLDTSPAALDTTESSTSHAETACELCSALVIGSHASYVPGLIEGPKSTYAAKHNLFHGPCAECDSEEFSYRSQLCYPCRHLRLRHLLLCSPLPGPYAIQILQPSWETSDACHLCRFWIAVAARKSGMLAARGVLTLNEVNSFSLWSNGNHGRFMRKKRVGFSRKSNQVVKQYIDWDWLRDWLHELPEPGLSERGKFSPPQVLHDLRVIDVFSSCITRLLPGSDYLALSYVWGPDSGNHIRCTTSNVETLSQAGALSRNSLPSTIADAIKVCKMLGHRFLWVDRLCIVQDDTTDALARQLDQMADIYHGAALTIIAMDGTSADNGLAGVSYARAVSQVAFNHVNSFELATSAPDFRHLLSSSKWWTRGWTFQEYIASKRLLFFTRYGLYLTNDKTGNEILAEGFCESSSMWNQEIGFDNMSIYTSKELTFTNDILRASSGLLRALYEDRLSYGMPWDEFDRAILWGPVRFDQGLRKSTNTNTFPTWSWVSCEGPVFIHDQLPPTYGLAYWSRPSISATGSLKWSAIAPNPVQISCLRSCSDEEYSEAATSAALAWLYGCIEVEAPSWLSIDCTRSEYRARLKEHWSTLPSSDERWLKAPSLFWKHAFQTYGDVSGTINEAALRKAGSLMVYTQKTSFVLDWRGQHRPMVAPLDRRGWRRPVIIRSKSQKIVGICELSHRSAQRLQQLDQTRATFIVLSAGGFRDREDLAMRSYIISSNLDLSVGAFYGCPCSAMDEEFDQTQHVPECPEHAAFRSIDPIRRRRYSSDLSLGKLQKDRDQAYAHHLANLSYYDINHELLHRRTQPPFLWAMLIAPAEGKDAQSDVYERIAIARIYLKRWVEASPSFEALVLV